MFWIAEGTVAAIALWNEFRWIAIALAILLVLILGLLIGRLVVTFVVGNWIMGIGRRPGFTGGDGILAGSVVTSSLIALAAFAFARTHFFAAILIGGIDLWGNYLSARISSWRGGQGMATHSSKSH